jgi:hypothetical protein
MSLGISVRGSFSYLFRVCLFKRGSKIGTVVGTWCDGYSVYSGHMPISTDFEGAVR